MNFSMFHAGVAMTLLAVAGTAQAATPRSEIARPTDYSAVAADRSIGGCESSRLAVCGRQVAGKLKWPAGVAGRDAYRFAEEEFLFDSGVGIFLQTAVSAQKGAAVEWRRRLAFKRTPAGSFQLVQVGMQYRCGSGGWQKTVCTVPKPAAPANVAKAAPGQSGQQPANQAAADMRQGLNAAEDSQAAAVQAGRAGAADATQGIDAASRAAGESAAGQGAEKAAAAMDDASRAAADAGASPAGQGARQAAGAGDASRTAANTGAQAARESASSASRAAGGAAAAAGAAAAGQQGAASSGQTRDAETGSALYPREENAPQGAPQGGLDARWRPRTQPEGAQQDPEERARQAAQRAVTGGDASTQEGVDQIPTPGQEGNTRRSAEIVAASPSVTADQLRSLREDEELANQSSGAQNDFDIDAAPGSQRSAKASEARRGAADAGASAKAAGQAAAGAAGATAASQAGDARTRAAEGTDAAASASRQAADAGGASGEGAATGESGQRQQMASAPTSLTPTAPQSVRSAKGFRQVVLRPEQLNRLGRLCEQPIDLCGQKVFDDLLAPEFFAELSPQQVQRERFIYADGPVVSAVYLVTMADLPDDALSAERVRIEFVRRGSGWVAVSVGRQVRCQKGYNDWTEAHCGG